MKVIKIDGSVPLRTGEEIALCKLNLFLEKFAPSIGQVISIAQFHGGYSNLTYCLTTSIGNYVLRRPPIGADIKSAHDMGREYLVLSKLIPHYRLVPTPIVFCEDAEIIGSPFYIMQRIEGIILRAHSTPKLGIEPQVFKTLSQNLVDNLVDLHSIDIQSSNLIELGKPHGYVQRQVNGWTKRYFNAETDSLPSMNAVAEWLPQNMPPTIKATFIHNDYKYDNLILNPTNLTQIIGVLDWEMATVGDPLMDLGAALAYWAEAGDDATTKAFNLSWLPGNLTRIELAERYAEKSGSNVSNLVFYYVFGLFKNAVIAQQIYSRWKKGISKDARFGGLIHVVRSLSAKAIHSIETQKI
jgi:aminoglycoside phosphotransferase (APT) family kinase protein